LAHVCALDSNSERLHIVAREVMLVNVHENESLDLIVLALAQAPLRCHEPAVLSNRAVP
jgi:hypothetical protein